MEMLGYLRRLFTYDDWANREAMAALRAAGTPPKRSLQTMAHIIGAERLWFHRLTREEEPVVIWPDFCVDECERHVRALPRMWAPYLSGLTPARLDETVSYVNSKNERWSSALGDVLMHVVMHSTYHRGQIARELRREGHTPSYTDFIEAARRKKI